jgi:hypothetical protein
MALKLLKALWFLSMVVALLALLYVYAGLPQQVVVQDEDGTRVAISNEAFFYVVMTFVAITNVLVFVVGKVFHSSHELRTWFYGLITSLNIFFIVGMNVISVYNSSEKFNYDRVAFVIYGSIVVMVLWAVAWPVYRLFKRPHVKTLV